MGEGQFTSPWDGSPYWLSKNKKWSVQKSYTCKQTVRIDSAICVNVFVHINMYVCV